MCCMHELMARQDVMRIMEYFTPRTFDGFISDYTVMLRASSRV